MIWSSRFAAVVTTLGVLSIAAAGCGGGEAEDTGEGPIKIGAIAQLSGAASFLGPSERAAYEAAVKELNENGGVLGREVALTVADDATDPNTANQAAKRLINQEGVAALFGSTTSASRESILPVVKGRGDVLFFYNAIYEGHACDPMMFAMGEVPEQQITPLVPYLKEKAPAKDTWYFVGDDYNWPHDTAKIAEDVIAENGGKVAGQSFVPIGTTEFSTVIQKVAASKADYVLLMLLPSDTVAFMKQLQNAGLSTKVTPIGLLVESSAIEAMGPAADGLLLPVGYLPTLDIKPAQQFNEKYERLMGEKAIEQNFIAINGYDAVHLWAKAVEKAGTTDAEAVAKALPQVKWTGPRGTVSYGAETHHATFPMFLAEVNEKGQQQVVHSFGSTPPGAQCDLGA